MQPVDSVPAPIPSNILAAQLRQIEHQLMKSPALSVHFRRLAKAWRSKVSSEESERFLMAFEASIDNECIVRGGLIPRPMTLRQRLENRRFYGSAFGYESFTEVAMLWHEWGRRDDAIRCMRKAEAQVVAMGRREWVVWDAVLPCYRAWLAMGLNENAAALLEKLQKKFEMRDPTDWIRLAELHGMELSDDAKAIRCLERAEAGAKTSRDFLAVAEGWVACLRLDDAVRCVREAEQPFNSGTPTWREIADAWRRLGFKDDSMRCAAKEEESAWEGRP